MKQRMFIIAILMLGIMGTARADIINGGFESGLEGWTNDIIYVYGTYETTTVSSYTTTENGHYSFTPIEGDSMLQIFMENPTACTYQDLFLNEGDTIQGYAGIDTIWLMSASLIFGRVSILNQNGDVVSVLWENAGGIASDWTFWSWDATQSGDYRLEFSFDPFPAAISAHTGYAFFDAIEVIEAGTTSAPVPEPSTMLLLGAGLLGLARFRKKAG